MKKCPNCGKQVDSNSKFCTYCGYQFADQPTSSASDQDHQAQSQAAAQSQAQAQAQARAERNQQWDERTQEAKQFSKNYFQWFVDTLKHPTRRDDTAHKYFGLTSFIISLVLILLDVMQGTKAVVTATTSGILGLLGSLSGQSAYSSFDSNAAYNSITIQAFTHFFFYILVALVITVLIPFLIRKAFYKDRISLGQFMNQFASYSNYVLLIEIVALVFFTLSVFIAISFIMMVFVYLGYFIAFVYSILSTDDHDGLDKIYALLIGFVAEVVIMTIVSVGIAF